MTICTDYTEHMRPSSQKIRLVKSQDLRVLNVTKKKKYCFFFVLLEILEDFFRSDYKDGVPRRTYKTEIAFSRTVWRHTLCGYVYTYIYTYIFV